MKIKYLLLLLLFLFVHFNAESTNAHDTNYNLALYPLKMTLRGSTSKQSDEYWRLPRYARNDITSVISLSGFLNFNSLDDIRSIKLAVHRAIESSSVTDSLYLALKSGSTESPLIVAYMGTLEALKAKHSWNPYHKIRYVSLSQKTMKKAVERDPNNLEIRFMRFSIQHYTPAFLGFSKDLEEDRKAIVRQFKNRKFGLADAPLIRNIAAFMIESDRCLKEELIVFKKYI